MKSVFMVSRLYSDMEDHEEVRGIWDEFEDAFDALEGMSLTFPVLQWWEITEVQGSDMEVVGRFRRKVNGKLSKNKADSEYSPMSVTSLAEQAGLRRDMKGDGWYWDGTWKGDLVAQVQEGWNYGLSLVPLSGQNLTEWPWLLSDGITDQTLDNWKRTSCRSIYDSERLAVVAARKVIKAHVHFLKAVSGTL